jgi:hypothetical protein
MNHVMPAGIGVIREIEALDFESDPEFISKKLHAVLRCSESIEITVCNVCDHAIFAALQRAAQGLIMPAHGKL